MNWTNVAQLILTLNCAFAYYRYFETFKYEYWLRKSILILSWITSGVLIEIMFFFLKKFPPKKHIELSPHDYFKKKGDFAIGKYNHQLIIVGHETHHYFEIFEGVNELLKKYFDDFDYTMIDNGSKLGNFNEFIEYLEDYNKGIYN